MTDKQKVGPIGICTHVFNSVDFDAYFNHLWCIYHWALDYELVFVGKKGLHAANARNAIIERCFEKKCRYAFFIDGDHLVSNMALPYLVESMTKHAEDPAMVSGVVCKKGESFQQVCWKVVKDTAGINGIIMRRCRWMVDFMRYLYVPSVAR